MEIGQKLKHARVEQNMTQEQVAAELGVSRQTVSNWENNRSYPDIVSVIRMSDLYAVSLDELLKEDREMIRHLKESTDEVKSREKLSRRILIAAYLVIWTLCVAAFWLGGRADAMGYSILVLWLLLPLVTVILSVMVGKDSSWGKNRWLMLLFFAVFYMLAPYATFSLANTASFGNVHLPEAANALPGLVCSAVGMGIGTLIRRRKEKKNSGRGE